MVGALPLTPDPILSHSRCAWSPSRPLFVAVLRDTIQCFYHRLTRSQDKAHGPPGISPGCDGGAPPTLASTPTGLASSGSRDVSQRLGGRFPDGVSPLSPCSASGGTGSGAGATAGGGNINGAVLDSANPGQPIPATAGIAAAPLGARISLEPAAPVLATLGAGPSTAGEDVCVAVVWPAAGHIAAAAWATAASMPLAAAGGMAWESLIVGGFKVGSSRFLFVGFSSSPP